MPDVQTFKTAYGPNLRIRKEFPEKSLTKQAPADECNINTIMARFEKTGMIEHTNKYQGDYGDFTEVQDFHTSILQVMAAREAFATLPAKVRARFENDPGGFIAFVDDPENIEEMMDMGLLPPRPIAEGPEGPVAGNIAGSPPQTPAPTPGEPAAASAPPAQ